MKGIGQTIRLFFGMVLFIPQLVLALFVGIGRLFPEGTFGTKGAVHLADITIDFVKDVVSDEDQVPVAKPSTRKPRATATKRKPRAKKKP